MRIQALAPALDKRSLTQFLIDFSWVRPCWKGGSYSALDTEALVQYGQRNPDKPSEDAVLVLNHKHAAEHLWQHAN